MTTPKPKLYFTFEERQEVEKLIKEGNTIKDISKKINRSKSGLGSEIRLNGGLFSYTALNAQERAEKIRKQTNERLSEDFKKREMPNPFIHLQKKIENIEMQLDIILDFIRKKNNDTEN